MIWSLTPTLFWQGGGNISLSRSVYLGLVMLDTHSTEPLVPELSASEVEMAVEKQKRHTSPGIDQMLAELIKAEDRTIHSEICKLINSVWNKEELPEELELIVVPIYNKGNKTDCSNCRGISLLPAMYRISSILLSKLTPCAEEIIGDHQCGF